MPGLLLLLFLLTALAYASVGFGGGSTYSSLLILYGVDFRVLPVITLTCNIAVVSGGVWRFSRAGHLSLSRLAPFLLISIPAAWLGGRLPVSETAFTGLLGAALLASGGRLAITATKSTTPDTEEPESKTTWFVAACVGGGIGLLSGLVGIGGGIFLAPVLYFLRWGSPRAISGACSLFILVNSMAGLLGQVTKLHSLENLEPALAYWPLVSAVLVGGQVGSWLASKRLPASFVKRLTAVLILYVAARLLYRWVGLLGS